MSRKLIDLYDKFGIYCIYVTTDNDAEFTHIIQAAAPLRDDHELCTSTDIKHFKKGMQVVLFYTGIIICTS